MKAQVLGKVGMGMGMGDYYSIGKGNYQAVSCHALNCIEGILNVIGPPFLFLTNHPTCMCHVGVLFHSLLRKNN